MVHLWNSHIKYYQMTSSIQPNIQQILHKVKMKQIYQKLDGFCSICRQDHNGRKMDGRDILKFASRETSCLLLIHTNTVMCLWVFSLYVFFKKIFKKHFVCRVAWAWARQKSKIASDSDDSSLIFPQTQYSGRWPYTSF